MQRDARCQVKSKQPTAANVCVQGCWAQLWLTNQPLRPFSTEIERVSVLYRWISKPWHQGKGLYRLSTSKIKSPMCKWWCFLKPDRPWCSYCCTQLHSFPQSICNCSKIFIIRLNTFHRLRLNGCKLMHMSAFSKNQSSYRLYWTCLIEDWTHHAI